MRWSGWCGIAAEGGVVVWGAKETIRFSSLSCPRAATVPETETCMAAHTHAEEFNSPPVKKKI